MNISILNRPWRPAEESPSDASPPVTAVAAIGVGVQVRERLWQRMARECEAMVQHALGTGLVVPADVMEHLDQAVSAPVGPITIAAPDRSDPSPADAAASTASAIGTSRFALLAAAHTGLAIAIAPATPEAVLLMADERERHPVRSEFGPLPLVRQVLGLAMLSLVVLLGVSTSAVVNTANMNKSLLELSGYPLFMIEIFLVSAASLGSCFANLQRINTVISDGTYDPRVQSTYWTRWVMGVISGVVLSQIVYDFFLAPHAGNDPTVRTASAAIGQPILALLGGYSVDFVHGILKRAINAVANFFGVSMDGADNQPRPVRAEVGAQQRLALASATVVPERAPAPSPEIEDLSRRANAQIQPITPKTS
jgi:hypothetical protein